MDPISLILFIAIGGIMIGAGVHFIPVGGAPAAMATATGVGTGTAMLAAGAGLTGLITAATMTGEPFYIVGIGGAIGAMIMMGITMLIANLIYIFGVGIVPAASKVNCLHSSNCIQASSGISTGVVADATRHTNPAFPSH